MGGAPGAIHHLLSTSHSPTEASSDLCSGPGAAISIHFFIIASWSGSAATGLLSLVLLLAGLSCAQTLTMTNAATSATHNAEMRSFMLILSLGFRFATDSHPPRRCMQAQLPLTSHATRRPSPRKLSASSVVTSTPPG